jgi:hypothetical protein
MSELKKPAPARSFHCKRSQNRIYVKLRNKISPARSCDFQLSFEADLKAAFKGVLKVPPTKLARHQAISLRPIFRAARHIKDFALNPF